MSKTLYEYYTVPTNKANIMTHQSQSSLPTSTFSNAINLCVIKPDNYFIFFYHMTDSGVGPVWAYAGIGVILLLMAVVILGLLLYCWWPEEKE